VLPFTKIVSLVALALPSDDGQYRPKHVNALLNIVALDGLLILIISLERAFAQHVSYKNTKVHGVTHQKDSNLYFHCCGIVIFKSDLSLGGYELD
jgi:hypothetical protein